jgi:hypothetical protein
MDDKPMTHEVGHYDEDWDVPSGTGDQGTVDWNILPEDDIDPTTSNREKPWYQPGVDFLEGLNSTVAAGFQSVFDVGRAAHGLIHPHDPSDPIAGASAVNDLFNYAYSLGPQMSWLESASPGDPSSYGGQIGKEAAYNLGSLIPIGMAANTTKFTYSFFQPIIEFVRGRPMTAVLMDLGLSVPMGTGYKYGQYLWGDTGGELGRIAGSGFLLAPALAYGTARSIFSKVKGIKGLGLTEEARLQITRDMLEGSMSKEQLAALKAGDYEIPGVGGPYPTGETLDAGGLTRLRSQIINQADPAIENEKLLIASRESALVEALHTLRVEPMDSEAKIFMANSIQNSIAKIKARVNKAQADAQARIDRLGPNTDIEVASKIARDEVDKAYKFALEEQDRIWKSIGDGRFRTQGIVDRARQIIADTPRLSGEGGAPDLPVAILEIAGRKAVLGPDGKVITPEVPSTLKSVETIEEIAALSKRINRDIDDAYGPGPGGGKPNLARQLGELRDAIYDDIIPVAGADASGLEAARAFSRSVNAKFTQGSVGMLLRTRTTGDLKVDPALTLVNLIRKGLPGKIAATQLRVAAEELGHGTENIDRVIQEHLLNLFAAQTRGKDVGLDDIPFSIDAARKFVRDNPVLDLYPKLRALMLDAKTAKQIFDNHSIAAKDRITSIEAQAIASGITNSEVPLRVSALFTSSNPVKDTDYLLRLAAEDVTGKATQGVKSAVFDHIIKSIVKTGKDNRDFIDSGRANAFINNKTYRQIIKKVYGNNALRLLDAVQKGMVYQARGRDYSAPKNKAAGTGVVQEFVGNFGTIMGARLGGRLMGHTLLAAGAGKRLALKFLNAITSMGQDSVLVLLKEALDDPAFARDLLTPTRNVSAEKALNLYSYGIVKDMINQNVANSGQIFEGADAVRSRVSAY